MGNIDGSEIDGLLFTALRQIKVEGGDVLHTLKASDEGFVGFGEVYFSFVKKEFVKGWKRHNRMTLNLVVPIGEVDFFVHDADLGVTKKITLGESNYGRLTIRPGLWVAFKGKCSGNNMVVNVGSIEHDPKEVSNRPIDTFQLQQTYV